MKKILLMLILLSTPIIAQEPQDEQQAQQSQTKIAPATATATAEIAGECDAGINKEKIDALLVAVDSMRKQGISDENILNFLYKDIRLEQNRKNKKFYIALAVTGVVLLALLIYLSHETYEYWIVRNVVRENDLYWSGDYPAPWVVNAFHKLGITCFWRPKGYMSGQKIKLDPIDTKQFMARINKILYGS